MIVNIIKNNLEELKYIFNNDEYCYSFITQEDEVPTKYILTVTNKKEISMEDKTVLFMLSEELKSVDINSIQIYKESEMENEELGMEIDEELNLLLFDSKIYNLIYSFTEFNSEYGTTNILSASSPYDQIKLTFIFNRQKG